MLKPDWFKDGEYLGTAKDSYGDYYQFMVQGGMKNYYDVYTKGKVPRRLKQVPRSDILYDGASFTEDFDLKVFDLPTDSRNCHNSCPYFSFCTIAKHLG